MFNGRVGDVCVLTFGVLMEEEPELSKEDKSPWG